MQQPRDAKLSFTPWLIVGLVVVCMAVVTIYVQRQKSRDDAVAPAQASSDTGVASSRAPAAHGSRTPIPGLSPTAQAVSGRRQAMAQQRKEAQARVDRTQAAFASRYETEPVDAGWASAKEAQLAKLATSDQIRQIGVEARNLNVDCKSSMCRVTGDFDSMGAGDDWFALYMNNVAEQVPVASYKYIRNPDGTVKINVYAVGRR